MTRFGWMILAGSLAALSGCGFQPVYAPPSADAAQAGGPITVTEIPGRSGFQLRQELDRLFINGAPGVPEDGARLEVTLSRQFQDFADLRRDATTRRGNVNAAVRYQLFNGSGRQIARGNVQTNIAYTQSNNAGSAIAAQGELTDLAAQSLARLIWSDVTRKLSQRSDAQAVGQEPIKHASLSTPQKQAFDQAHFEG